MSELHQHYLPMALKMKKVQDTGKREQEKSDTQESDTDVKHQTAAAVTAFEKKM